MDRLGLRSGELAHPLGRPARGGRQHHVQAHLPEQGRNGPDGGGLSGAGAAGENQHVFPGRQLHGLALLGGIGDALGPFQLVHRPPGGDPALGLRRQQGLQAQLGGALRLPQPPEVTGVHIGHPLLNHLSPANKLVQGQLRALLPALEELGRGGHQLPPGEEDVAVVFVVAQLKAHRRLEPGPAVGLKAHAHGDPVRHGEGHAAFVARQQIGVLPELFQRRAPVLPPQAHGQHRGQLIPGQEGHQPPQAHVLPEGLADLLGPPGGDALEGGQPFRGGLQHVESLQAEAVHHVPGRGGAHALQNAGGKVAEHLRLVLRQSPLHLRRPELFPVLGVALPCAGDAQALAGGGAGDAAHNGDDLPLLGEEAEDRVPVFGVLKDDAMYRALPADELFHLGYPLFSPSRRAHISAMMSPGKTRAAFFSRSAKYRASAWASGVSPQSARTILAPGRLP